MLRKVEVRAKSLEDYHPIVGGEVIAEIRGLAESLKGARVVHINSTPYGGGVAEILSALVPLMCDTGLEAEWQVISGDSEFFSVTKAFHNALQGADIPLTEEMKSIYNRYSMLNAETFEGEYDFVVVHDPQPAGLLHFHGREGGRKWIWRCHIDTSTTFRPVWEFLRPYLEEYDAAIFTMRDYAGDAHFERLALIPPSLDPLSPKNSPLSEDECEKIVAGFGVDTKRPLLLQVSRFDPWKDPLGVIDAYRIVKKEFPDAQLALVGSMALDDPEGWYYLDKTSRYAGDDFDIYILHNFHGVHDVEVNAFQRDADVVIQKSIREGFALVVTEALWKRKPVVGGNVGGIPLQVIDGKTGFLVDSIEECAEKILYLLEHPEESKRMGERAREHVRGNFLITRHLKDYLKLFISMTNEPMSQ
jgi:trehalose synthase